VGSGLGTSESSSHADGKLLSRSVQVNLKSSVNDGGLQVWNKPEQGTRSFTKRFGIFSLLAVREMSYYLITQVTLDRHSVRMQLVSMTN
jgi:hypothetical protein